MNQRIPSDPEQHEPQQILDPEPHDADPPAPRGNLHGALRSRARVRGGDVLADIAAAALDEADDQAVQDRRDEVERESRQVREPENAGDEAGEA